MREGGGVKRKYHPTLHTTIEPWRPRYDIRGMGVQVVTPGQREALGDVCLGIFADMTNAGAPLPEILAACYMSGMQHTISILSRPNKK